MKTLWLCIVPLFVAVDAIGVMPMFLGLTEGLDRKRKHRVIVQSVLTALSVGLAFLFAGEALLAFIGITIPDFMIAGGSLLFALSLSDMLSSDKPQRRTDLESVGAVPIGVPLIVGPAVLTTTILLEHQYGPLPTVIALCVNVLFAGAVFWFSEWIDRLLGKTGSKVVSKLASLLLMAIAVMIVRKGFVALIATSPGAISSP